MVAGAGLGLAVEACRAVTRGIAALDRAIRPMSLVASIPFVDRAAQRVERAADGMNDTWRGDRTESMAIAESFADALVPDLVEAMVAHLNLTDLVVERVTNGKPPMPAFKGQLSEQEIDAVATYVSTVAGK